MKQFVSVNDVADIDALVQKALAYKANPFSNKHLGEGKRIGLLFLNPSLRTRLSTQVAASNLGMEAIVFNVDKEGWALEFEEGAIMSGTTVEHIKDAAPILGNYFDILAIRTFPSLANKEDDYSEMYIKQFIKYAGVPVVSLESATLHPLQSLTDIITIQEDLMLNAERSTLNAERSMLNAERSMLNAERSMLNAKSLMQNANGPQPSAFSPQPSAFSPQPSAFSPQPSAFSPQPSAFSPQPSALSPQPSALSIKPKIVLTWAPHVKPLPQCVANSFAQWVNAWGEADFVIAHPEDYELSEQFTKGATITHDQDEALKGADYVYVKNWSTFNDYGKMYENDPRWMMTNNKLALTNNAKVMHCLPVRRNVELSDEILDGPNSLVTQQASNRVWAAQAVLSTLLTSLKGGTE